jgi:hypothetical protein
MKKYIALLSFFVACVSQATTVLLNGVTVGMTDFNSKKMFDGTDDDLCWAFAASNAIAYWQWNQFGNNLPAGIPSGLEYTGNYSGKYTEITEAFYKSWTNGGGFEKVAFTWWFTGEDISKEMESESVLKDTAISAGFYEDTIYTQGEFVKEFDIAENTDVNYIKEVMDYVINNNGAFTLEIVNPELESGHAITLWGYEIVDDEITGLYISDSDDDCETNVFVEIEWDSEFDGGAWVLQDEDYKDYYIDGITGLVTVPEPSTYALIFSAIALVFVAYRRRIK